MREITRRGFFGILTGAVAATIIEPRKVFVLPPSNGWTQSDSGLWGIGYWNVATHSGNYSGLERAIYPGRLSTPSINPNYAFTATASLIREFNKRMRGPFNSDRLLLHGEK